VFGMPRNWQDPLAVAPPATAQPPVPTTPTAPQSAYGGLQH
jgi:hypothetical protein